MNSCIKKAISLACATMLLAAIYFTGELQHLMMMYPLLPRHLLPLNRKVFPAAPESI